MASANDVTTGLLTRLSRTRASVRVTLVVERLWPLLLPLLVIASLFLSLSWLGAFRLLPDWARLSLVAVLALCALAALYPLRFYRRPTSTDVDERIEAANLLEHAPLRTQTDTLSAASQDSFARALWQEHQKRMAERLGQVSGDMPRTRVPERDPWGVRAAAALLLAIAFAFSFGSGGGTPADAFRSHSSANSIAARIDAWVTPPAYTGRAPLFLTADTSADMPVFNVPAGSELAVRVAGGTGEETLSWLAADNDEAIDVTASEDGTVARPAGTLARQFGTTLVSDGMVTLRADGDDLRRWAFTVIPDHAPVIRLTDEPRRAVNGALELSYEIEDDYGPTQAMAIFKQSKADPAARALYEAPEMPLTLARRGDDTHSARTSRDLTEHAWAGSQVEMKLRAKDAAGQEAESETLTINLPERSFANPLARALVEQRRILALDANRKPHVLALMDAITLHPEETIPELAHYLGIVAAMTRLHMATSDDELRDVADYLWTMALTVEDGALSAAERRLRQAREALKQAIENSASDEELQQLMTELREAMRDFMRELAERALENPNLSQQMPGDAQQLSQSDLERMMDELENLARSGARDQAMAMLQQLQEMMNNLQAGNQGQQGQGQQSEMHQQMNKLGEMMQRQQELMNETFRQQQQREQGQMSPEELAEALRELQQQQGELQQQLQELGQALEGMGLQPGEGFGDAGDAMGRAEGSLGQGQGERAVGEQGQALEALRRGAQDMMQQMMQAMGEDGQGEQGGRQQNADRDPLGRPRATTGPDFGSSVRVPDEIDVQRAREILEEIRRRLGNALSPELERNYLERLLEMR